MDTEILITRAPTAAIRDFLRRTISLSDVLIRIWAGRWIIVAACVLGLLGGALSVWRANPTFLASVYLMPAETDSAGETDISGGGAAGLLAGLTGMGSGGAVPKFTQFLSAMHSVGVAEILDRKYGMLCRVYGSDCDQRTHQWRERHGVRAWFAGAIAKLGHLPDPNGPRTPIDLAGYIEGSIFPSQDKITRLTRLGYANQDAKFAAEFLTTVIRTTNDYIKDHDRNVQRHYVDYVAERANASANVAQRETLSGLLLQQERRLMMTEVDVPYAATILDGPTVVPVNSALKTLAVYGLLGFFLGIMIVLGCDFVPARWRFWQKN